MNEFFFGWFSRLSPGDTIGFFILIGFMVIVYLRYYFFKKKPRKKKKNKKSDGSDPVTSAGSELSVKERRDTETSAKEQRSLETEKSSRNSNKIDIPKDL